LTRDRQTLRVSQSSRARFKLEWIFSHGPTGAGPSDLGPVGGGSGLAGAREALSMIE
jgi:hypothetical protein